MGKHIKTDFLYDLVQEDEMKFMSEDVKKTIGSFGLLLCEAISLFYRKDAEKLFAFDVGEWAMVGCVYRYMWCLMQASRVMKSFDIDVEYNRMAFSGSKEHNASEPNEEEKRTNMIKGITQLAAEMFRDMLNRDNNAYHKIIGKMNAKATDFLRLRPDIIVHRRGEIGRANNGLWVEFKKEGCEIRCRERCKAPGHEGCKMDETLFDQAKVMFNTSQTEEGFNYQIGAMVMLRKNKAHIGFFSNGTRLCGVVVTADGCEPMSKEDAGKNLWCRPMLDNGEIEDSDLSLTQTAVCLHKCQWT